MRKLKEILVGIALLCLAIFVDRSFKEEEMEPKRIGNLTEGMKLWLLAALTVILINMMVAQRAYGQSIVRAPLGAYGAITTCDQSNNIVVVVNNTVTSDDYPEVLLHEFTHVEEMKAYSGGCQAMLNRYRADSDFRFAVEARAYCKGYEHLVRNGMPRENIAKLAVYMQTLYAKEKTVAEVQNALPCNPLPRVAQDGTRVSSP